MDNCVINQTGTMNTSCLVDEAAGFAENLRKHPQALRAGNHDVLLSGRVMPVSRIQMGPACWEVGGSASPDGSRLPRSAAKIINASCLSHRKRRRQPQAVLPSPENAPLIAITRIPGNRRRTTERNSKPDMPGMFRSERMMSGISCRISDKAEKPSSAERTLYPNSVKMCDSDIRRRRIIVYDKQFCKRVGHHIAFHKESDKGDW